jgi:23S rRNA (cytidine2498-2'-O)-methyltransferase
MTDRPQFLFVTCQVGAEASVKTELRRRWPDFRLAYSRPGYLTFKLPAGHRLMADFDLQSAFARAYGFSLGKVSGDDLDELARRVWETYGDRPLRRLHVWQRDAARPGDHDFEPSIPPAAIEAREVILRHCPWPEKLAEGVRSPWTEASRGEFVLDCVLVGPHEWWVGYHRVKSMPSRWPGGMIQLELPPNAVSRAWLKMEEALRWSQLPIPAGARCVEIGSAPGGASQALLGRGLIVTAVDPAEMHARVLEHPDFTHVRRRAAQVRRREFRKMRWLVADMNVVPSYTCDVVESIVTHPEVSVRGIILTLKLTDQSHADALPQHLDRVRGWGYNVVLARQLQYNRQEACVAALQKPFLRKSLRPLS